MPSLHDAAVAEQHLGETTGGSADQNDPDDVRAGARCGDDGAVGIGFEQARS